MNFLEKLPKYTIYIIPLIIFAIFFQLFQFDLSYLDLQKFQKSKDILTVFTKIHNESGSYYPLTIISFYINEYLGGENFASYILFNLIIHSTASIAFYYLLLKFDFNRILSFFAVLIFAIHPFLINNLLFLSERSFLLTTMFGLIYLNFYIDYLKKSKFYELIIAGIFLFSALLSDVSAFAFFGISVVYTIFYGQQNLKENFNQILIVLISTIILWVILYQGAAPHSEIIANAEGSGIQQNINFSNYYIIPQTLAIFLLPFEFLPVKSNIYTIIGIILLSAAAIIALFDKRRNYKLTLFCLSAFFVLMILTIFGGMQNHSNYYDFSAGIEYITSIAAILLISSIFQTFTIDYTSKYILFLPLLLIFYSASTLIKAGNFRTKKTFYTTAFENNSRNNYLGSKIIQLSIDENKIDQAEKIAVKYKNTEASGAMFSLLGNYFYSKKQFDKAETYFENASQKSDDNSVIKMLAGALYAQHKFDKAAEILSTVYKDSVNFPEAKWNLFNIYLETKEFTKATDFGVLNFTNENDIIRSLEIVDMWAKRFYTEKDNAAVVKAMKTGLAIDPENAVIINYLYDTYNKIGMKEKAAEYEKKLKEIYEKQVGNK